MRYPKDFREQVGELIEQYIEDYIREKGTKYGAISSFSKELHELSEEFLTPELLDVTLATLRTWIPEVKERRKEYYQKPEVKKRQREYKGEYNRDYYQKPEVKKRQREYHQRPEVKERKRRKSVTKWLNRHAQPKYKLTELGFSHLGNIEFFESSNSSTNIRDVFSLFEMGLDTVNLSSVISNVLEDKLYSIELMQRRLLTARYASLLTRLEEEGIIQQV